jgi:hypothetical protein
MEDRTRIRVRKYEKVGEQIQTEEEWLARLAEAERAERAYLSLEKIGDPDE